MPKKQDIRRYSREELEAARARGESQTDWARVAAKTDAELAQDTARDPDWRDIPADWYTSATLVMPAAKQLLSLRLDADIVAWFREQGPGYQTRINAVLRAFVNQQTKPPPVR
jgi:uncharacterized protein (DUF4415 family)